MGDRFERGQTFYPLTHAGLILICIQKWTLFRRVDTSVGKMDGASNMRSDTLCLQDPSSRLGIRRLAAIFCDKSD